MKKKQSPPKTIVNRRASHDYNLDDSIVVGLELTGAETKALRLGHGQLRGAYITVKDDQLWLINAKITGTHGIVLDEQEQLRTRRLLAKRKEIDSLIEAKKQGQTIVPLQLLINGRFIKLRIAAGKGKKLYDKRATLKEREQKRSIDSAIKHNVKR